MADMPKIRSLEVGLRVALVVSECQPALIDSRIALFPGLAQQVESRDILTAINRLSAACREANAPVIHSVVALSESGHNFPVHSVLQGAMRRNPLLRSNRPEAGVDPRLTRAAADILSIRSEGISGFYASDLEARLHEFCVQTIILAGVSTNIALVGMAMDAANRSFNVVIAEDCTAGASAETHDHAVLHTLPLLATITRSDAIIAALRSRAQAIAQTL